MQADKRIFECNKPSKNCSIHGRWLRYLEEFIDH